MSTQARARVQARTRAQEPGQAQTQAQERGRARTQASERAGAKPQSPPAPRPPRPPRQPQPSVSADAAPRPTRSDRASRVGSRGEQVAADYLRHRGYRLLERNWRSSDPEVRGELDLVLRHRGTLVICEVKARTGSQLAHPAEAVTAEKAARLRRLAAVWLREHPNTHRRRPSRTAHAKRLPALLASISSVLAPTSAPTPGSARPAARVATIRIDVVAVRLGPREPFPILDIDHLIGVA